MDDRWKDRTERKLHDFFQSINQPYKVFEAESLQTFSQAIEEIDRQQYRTLLVEELLPREYKSQAFYLIAFFTVLLLGSAHETEKIVR